MTTQTTPKGKETNNENDNEIKRDTTTLSPTPFSPFSSSHSFGSDGGTSDEPGDLGQLTAVFAALRDEYRPRLPIPLSSRFITPSSSLQASASDEDRYQRDLEQEGLEEEKEDERSVWDHDTLSEYLAASNEYRHQYENDVEDDEEYQQRDPDGDDDEENYISGDLGDSSPGAIGGLDQPSLGYLDGVLGFLAAEREKLISRPRPYKSAVSNASTTTLATTMTFATTTSASARSGPRSTGTGGGASSTSESAWRHVIEPRRKRRRKRGKHNGNGAGSGSTSGPISASASIGLDSIEGVEETPMGDLIELEGSSSGADFEYRMAGKSMPSTPPRSLRAARSKSMKGKGKDVLPDPEAPPAHKLTHSRSTPSLRLTIPTPPDARVLRLRTLAVKLRMLFTDDAKTLSNLLVNDVPEEDGFVDVRGKAPLSEEGEKLVHVFIDHSNILIGFLNHLRRFPVHPARRPRTHMSHAALSLILERGRAVSRRVLATSSPLYQPMDGAERLGYEVRVYARVPDLGDGPVIPAGAMGPVRSEREPREKEGGNIKSPRSKKNRDSGSIGIGSSPNMRESASRSKGSTSGPSGDSDPGPGAQPVSAPSKHQSHTRSTSLTQNGQVMGPNGINASNSSLSSIHASPLVIPGALGQPPRIRYREQGVDELLQLKLHQALADAESPPPPGSTIVLATGDGNAGQFNEEGFLGCVRTALKRGWRVELYAWEVGLSKSWTKEFGVGAGLKGEGPYGDQFRIVALEPFAQDLLEIL